MSHWVSFLVLRPCYPIWLWNERDILIRYLFEDIIPPRNLLWRWILRRWSVIWKSGNRLIENKNKNKKAKACNYLLCTNGCKIVQSTVIMQWVPRLDKPWKSWRYLLSNLNKHSYSCYRFVFLNSRSKAHDAEQFAKINHNKYKS